MEFSGVFGWEYAEYSVATPFMREDMIQYLEKKIRISHHLRIS
jgi:hypothetical protein